MKTSIRNNSTNDEKASVHCISASSYSKLLLQFENFVASTDHSAVARPVSRSNRPPQEILDSANHLAQLRQQQQCNRRQQPVNHLMIHHQFNKFGEYPTHTNMLRSTQTSSTRNTYSHRFASSRLASAHDSPSSTHSSPNLHTSNMSSSTHSSPILPSSTHSSPILHTSRTPSPTHSAPSSLIPHLSHVVPPSMHNGVEPAAATCSGQSNFDLATLASKRDPVTNKIIIKPTTGHTKDKDSVPGTSKSVIAQKPTSSHVPRTAAAAESAKCQLGGKKQTVSSSAPFSLPPLSVRSTGNQNQEKNLPDLLKPNNLAKYIEASARKKRPVEKSSQAISVLLDHDYSRTAYEEKPVEKKLKRTFIIPKKRATTAVSAESEIYDDLEVVDMECSNTENDGSIIVNERRVTDKNEKPYRGEVAEAAEVVTMLLYDRDEFRTECKLIDEESELRYTNERNNTTASCRTCYGTLRKIRSDLIDPSSLAEGTSDHRNLLGYTNTSGLNTGPWWQEIENVSKSASDSEGSSTPRSSEEDEEEELMAASDAAAAINNFGYRAEIADTNFLVNLQEPGFCSVPSFAKNSDSLVGPENLYLDQLDVKEEIVECATVSEVVQTEADVFNEFFPRVGRQFVSLLAAMPHLAPETSDTGSISPDESKENMLDKVPAYILSSGRLSTKKNVLQRLNVKQDSGAIPGPCNHSWNESCKKLVFSMDCEKSHIYSPTVYESGSPSTSEFSMSCCRTRSPSPDCTRRSRSSRRENHHRKPDRHIQRQQQWSRSRSRSPSYSLQQASKFWQQTEQNEEDEQRRVVYVGKLPNNFTDGQLIDLFRSHGEIEKVSLHFRSAKDNYGFVTFRDKIDATQCLEVANKIPNFPFEVCYGGRRDFCKEEYADLDGITEQQEECGPVLFDTNEETSFDQLLKQYSRDRKQ